GTCGCGSRASASACVRSAGKSVSWLERDDRAGAGPRRRSIAGPIPRTVEAWARRNWSGTLSTSPKWWKAVESGTTRMAGALLSTAVERMWSDVKNPANLANLRLWTGQEILIEPGEG